MWRVNNEDMLLPIKKSDLVGNQHVSTYKLMYKWSREAGRTINTTERLKVVLVEMTFNLAQTQEISFQTWIQRKFKPYKISKETISDLKIHFCFFVSEYWDSNSEH